MMFDKKLEETIDILIKKLKENNLSSIKISDKTNAVEISNSSKIDAPDNYSQNISPAHYQSSQQESSNELISIDSPMVGIIYLTPKPSSPPFVKKGQKIKKGDTICLIEAMKTFNEIKSDRDCTIKSVMVKNGEAVEFGQPLFEIL